jgi:hypothetical protein
MMHMHTSADTFTPARPRRHHGNGRAKGHHGGGEPTVDLCVSAPVDGRILITARAGVDLGALSDLLCAWDDDDSYVGGAFCSACACFYLLPLIARPWAYDRDGDVVVMLWTMRERQALLDSLVTHIH